MGVAVVVSTASYWAYSAVRPMKRDAVPGVASVKGLQPVIMERSLRVIDEELQVAGPMCRRRRALAGTRCR
jgi:hypothetical protein